MAKAQSAPPASADHQGRKAPLAHPAPPDQLARRVTPARHRQFASSLVWIAFAAETTRSWLVLFARAVRPTERSARPLARQQLVYVYAGDLGIASRLHLTFSRSWDGSEVGLSLPRQDFGRALSISSLLGNLQKRNPQSRPLPASRQTVVALPLAAT